MNPHELSASGTSARPVGDNEILDEERWTIPETALLVTAASLALWTVIIGVLLWFAA